MNAATSVQHARRATKRLTYAVVCAVVSTFAAACGNSAAPTNGAPALVVQITVMDPSDSILAGDKIVIGGEASASDIGTLPNDSLWWTDNGTTIGYGPAATTIATTGPHVFTLHARYGSRADSASRAVTVDAGIGRLMWEVQLDSNPGDGLTLSPDGRTLYATEDTGTTAVAIGLDGSVLWRKGLGVDFRSPLPAVGPDGVLYYPYYGGPTGGSGNWTGGVVALSPNGFSPWIFITANHTPALDSSTGYTIGEGVAVDASGRLFFPSKSTGMYSLTSSGVLRWRRDTPNAGFFDGGFTVLDGDSLVVALPRTDSFPAFTADSGVRRWGAAVSKQAWCAVGPAVGRNGDLYVPQLYLPQRAILDEFDAYRPDGTLRWSRGLPEPLMAGEPVVGKDRIYFGSTNGSVLVLSTNGDAVATFGPPLGGAASGALRDGLTLAAHGVIYLAATDTLFSYDAQGARRFATPIPNHPSGTCWDVQGGPVIGADGTVYVRASDYGVIAIRDTVGPATDAPWPTLQGSFRRAGRRATDY